MQALGITLDREPPALRSTRNRPRTAVHRGANWTAAYHLQLTVAAVARPVRGSVVPLGVLAAERSWVVARPDGVCPAEPPAGLQRSGVDGRSVSGVRCPPIRFVVRDAAVPPSSVRPSGVQRVQCPAVRCPAVRLVSTRPASSRLLSVPVRPDASVSSHLRRRRRTRLRRPGNRHHSHGSRSCGGCPVGRLGRGLRSPGVATPPRSRGGQSGCRWRTRAGLGRRRPRVPAERPGRPGRRKERRR
jgi:hypothetical protein